MRAQQLSLIIFIILVYIVSHQTQAQTAKTEHTFKLDPSTPRPKANLKDVDWLVGDWVGTAFGKQFEEVWNPASAGSMVGMYKLFDNEKITFYELLLLVEEEGSLSLKVKHFSADFHAWEDKEEFINFKLVKIEPNAIHFSGLSFYRDGPDKINGYIVFKDKQGEVTEERMIYERREKQ